MVGNPLYEKAIKNGVKVVSINNVPNYRLDQEGKFNFIKSFFFLRHSFFLGDFSPPS
jgi:hypothetical protein